MCTYLSQTKTIALSNGGSFPSYHNAHLFVLLAEHGLHNWLNTRPGGKDDIAAMSLIDNDSNTNTSVILIDQSVRINNTKYG